MLMIFQKKNLNMCSWRLFLNKLIEWSFTLFIHQRNYQSEYTYPFNILTNLVLKQIKFSQDYSCLYYDFEIFGFFSMWLKKAW